MLVGRSGGAWGWLSESKFSRIFPDNFLITLVLTSSIGFMFTNLPNANEMDTNKHEMYMPNARFLHWGPNGTYIPLAHVGVLH